MGFGYHGAYLRIDATRGTFERVPLDAAVLRRYLGGSGLGARLLLDEGGAIADPLSPENVLKSSGRGIFLIQSFMDEMELRRAPEGGMEVVMVKRVQPQQTR